MDVEGDNANDNIVNGIAVIIVENAQDEVSVDRASYAEDDAFNV